MSIAKLNHKLTHVIHSFQASIHRDGSRSDRAEHKIELIQSDIKKMKETQDRETFALLDRLVDLEKIIAAVVDEEESEEDSDEEMKEVNTKVDEVPQEKINADIMQLIEGLQDDIQKIRSNVASSANGVIYSTGQAYYDM